MKDYMFEDNAAISGNIAAEGMILLENRDETLPLVQGTRLAVFGRGQLEFSMCGTGSGSVLTAYGIDFVTGLLEAEAAGKLALDHEVLDNYRATAAAWENKVTALADMAGIDDGDDLEETDSELPYESMEAISAAAQRSDAAVFIISRNAGEGGDRRDVPGDFRLSAYEETLLDKLIASDFEKIIVIINSGGLIDLSWIKRSDKLKALIMAWQPGMQGGRALARILSGEVCPSGRLPDTVAMSYADYPSSEVFNCNNYEMVYQEDIFVGYRYFETVPGAKEKVLYPFGYGLSYTTFEIIPESFECDGQTVRCGVKVTNTGKCPGREVVQLYSSRDGGCLEYPAMELRAFAKTAVLAPGESRSVELVFDVDSLASFDDTGATGAPVGSFVLEKGCFSFHAGCNIRNTRLAGTYELAENRVLSSPGLLLQGGLARRMHADGSFTSMPYPAPSADEDMPWEKETVKPEKPVMLSQVASGEYTLDQFIAQLSRKELLHLAHGQNAFATGSTGGIGDLRRYGIPNPQTADGPAGVRQHEYSTGFPCGTLIASSWDEALQYRMGETFGSEAAAFQVDILLAPALNIHRDPLCGRNFEYFSEDPLLSGKTAANIVNGIQSRDVGATIKHFAANSRENRRKFTNSVISERALREIYLKGFEITVRESHPWCVMSAYNLINGRKCSANYNLLCRILRDEWGFDGLVMTDWVTHAHIWEEIVAGNDVKMPGREVDIYQQTQYMDQTFHLVPRHVLERNAARILRVIMKTHRFRRNDFGRVLLLPEQGDLRMFAAEMSSIMVANSNIAPCRDVTGGYCHCHLQTLAHGNYRQQLFFVVDAASGGRYQAWFRLAADRPGTVIELYLGDERVGRLDVAATCPRRSAEEEKADPNSVELQSWGTQGGLEFDIPAGISELKVCIDTAPGNASGINMNYIDLIRVNG